MARLARVVAPGYPHHVTQRGNRRQSTFFEKTDYQFYLDLLAEWCPKHGVRIWAYCLMPNHVHLVAVPSEEQGLALAIGEVHRRYTRAINFRMGWRGHLWQGRFQSAAMDENHLLAAVRYIELNPVRARIVKAPQDYPWSSACHHFGMNDDPLVFTSPVKELVADWREFVRGGDADEQVASIRRAQRSGRPLGSTDFVDHLEETLGRKLRKNKPGPKAKIK
jgi:putative transposase